MSRSREQIEKELKELKENNKDAWLSYGSELCAGEMLAQEKKLEDELKANTTFDEWLYKVCEHKSEKSRGRFSPQDFFEHIDLTDAKLAFIDGEAPEEYKLINLF